MALIKNKYQAVLVAIIISLGLFSLANFSLAQTPPEVNNLVVNFSSDPLFNGANFMPGDTKTGEAEVINNTIETKKIASEAINFSTRGLLNYVPDNDLSHALEIIIKEKNGAELYGGSLGAKTLFEFFENGETFLSGVSGSGGVKTYQFIISFPTDKEDEWQGKTTKFDIIVRIQGEEGVSSCNNNGNQDNNETGIDCGGGGCPACSDGDGGGTGGRSGSTGGGGGLPQGLIISNIEGFNVGLTSVIIKWSTSYKATSQVIYCKQSEGCVFDLSDNTGNPPLYGYFHTSAEMHTPANPNGVIYREMELTGLDSGTTYEYRAISHASPPTISRGYSFTTLAAEPIVEKAVEKNIADKEAPSGEINSASPENSGDLAFLPVNGTFLTPEPSTEPASNKALTVLTQPPTSSLARAVSDEKSPERFLFLASIGSIITLGTGSIWIGFLMGILMILIIGGIIYYFMQKERRKNLK